MSEMTQSQVGVPAALVEMFTRNFSKFEAHVDEDVRHSAPAMRAAAE